MLGDNYTDWGSITKIKWVVIEIAPLTASARNEILAGAETKDKATKVAKLLDYTGPSYKVVKLEDLKQKEEPVQEDEFKSRFPHLSRMIEGMSNGA